MPIPHFKIKHPDDVPPSPPPQPTKEEQRKAFYKKNRWVIVGGISLGIALIGIGYALYSVISIINKSDEDVTSMQQVKEVVVDSFESEEQEEGGWLSKALPDSKLLAYLPLITGEHRFLVLLQNSTELRATGGFIGTLATIQTRDTTLTDYKTFDSYSVDVKNKDPRALSFPVAPAPIKKYLGQDRLYLRDSNWFPDFRDSAQLLTALYPIISKDTKPFDAVIALNPSVVADSLGLLGPMVIDDIEFTKENFIEALEYEVEINAPVYRGKPVDERKEIINTLLRELVGRITSLPKKRQLEFLKLAESKLIEKEIQLFFIDQELQNATERLGYAGDFEECTFDCLAVVDSNLRALKTDAVVSRSIAYSMREKNGSVHGKLLLTYINKGYYDWKTTDYRSYTRVYFPKGSRIASVKHLNQELGIYQSLATDEEGEYRGRSYVGFFHTTKVKTTGEVVVEYELPLQVASQIQRGEYSLTITKQSGTYPEFSMNADFEYPVKAITGVKGTIDNENAVFATKLISDTNIQLDLSL